ncbi:MAG: STAS-like domain-containing protein [Spirochaetes bacterium]|nr:STAS-like domain-containing protein [Spirochaetota bacterium]MBN2772101.1 STAS-like domain-containing protein [Spirochaetota bacterium]
MIISIKKIAKTLKSDSPDLLTRPTGRRFFEQAIKKLENASTDETVICDFSGIEVIDPSFVDEFIVKLIKTSQDDKKPFYIRLKNISSVVEENIRSVFTSYCEFAKTKFSVITEDITKDNTHIIGIASDTEREIIEIMRINGTMATETISKHLGLNPVDTAHILEQMHKDRLVKKDSDRYLVV